MANVKTLSVEANGYRNVVIRATMFSDGTVDTTTIYNATSGGAFGINYMGQTLYPGIHTTIVGLHYDVQDMKIRLQWEATTDTDVLPLGSAPEDFDWKDIGGIRVPSGLAGATGSLKILTVDPQINSTYFVLIYLRKNIP